MELDDNYLTQTEPGNSGVLSIYVFTTVVFIDDIPIKFDFAHNSKLITLETV